MNDTKPTKDSTIEPGTLNINNGEINAKAPDNTPIQPIRYNQ